MGPVVILLFLSYLQCCSCVSNDLLIRKYFELGYSNFLIVCFLSALHGVILSVSTVKRSLRKQTLQRRGPISYRYLQRVVDTIQAELNQSGSTLGYRAMHLKLRRIYGLRVPRDFVRQLLLVLDPAGVRLRLKNRMVRRRYYLKGPGYCWHIDGLDKLKTYGFAIHGGIDGFSRKVLWLEVATTNNSSSVIAGYFLDAVRQYGCPTILRCDRGSENSRIAYLQPFLRRHGTDAMANEKSFQYGKSASNQRIECWWSLLRKWYTEWWLDFFRMLKSNGHYDETDAIHVDCLRFSFMAILQKELDNVCKMWNSHLIRKSRHHSIAGIPNELFYIPHIQGYNSHLHEGDSGDLNFCFEFSQPKPQSVPTEFSNLANIIMRENGWTMPENCSQALTLYMDLLSCF